MTRVSFNKKQFIIDTLNELFDGVALKSRVRPEAVSYIRYRILKEAKDNANQNTYERDFRINNQLKQMVAYDDLKKKSYLDKPYLKLTQIDKEDLQACFEPDITFNNLLQRNSFIQSRHKKDPTKRVPPGRSLFHLLCLFLKIETGSEDFFKVDNVDEWYQNCRAGRVEETNEIDQSVRKEWARQQFALCFDKEHYNVIFPDESSTNAKTRSFGISNYIIDGSDLILRFRSLDRKKDVREGRFEVFAQVHGAFYAIEKDPIWGYVALIKKLNNSLSTFSVYYLGSHQIEDFPLAGPAIAIESDKLINPVRDQKHLLNLVYQDSEEPIDSKLASDLEEASWTLKQLGNPIIEFKNKEAVRPTRWTGQIKLLSGQFYVELSISILDQHSKVLVEMTLSSNSRQIRLVTEPGFYSQNKGYMAGQIFEASNGEEGESSGVFLRFEALKKWSQIKTKILTGFFSEDNEEETFIATLDKK